MIFNTKTTRTWTPIHGGSSEVEIHRTELGELTGEVRYYTTRGTVITKNGALAYDGNAITGVTWGWLR